MDSKTISRYRLFGKAGKIVMTVLSVIAALITACCCAATVFVATLPEDALTVRVVEHTELRFNAESFNALWNILGGSFGYAGEGSPEDIFREGESSVVPPENQKFSTELRLFNRAYDSAEIRADGTEKIMEADASPAEYNANSLTRIFVLFTLLAASVAAALWMLRRLFAALNRCQSPFCDEVVAKMRGFGFSLLPVAVFASVGETLWGSFLAADRGTHICIQWGVLIAFAVTMALVAVFKYGVRLQKESDETL